MDRKLRNDSEYITEKAIKAVMPDEAVKRALKGLPPVRGRVILVSVGKAAYSMAQAAVSYLGISGDAGMYGIPGRDSGTIRAGCISRGIVITKYGHVMGELPGIECFEAGHPVPDLNGFAATQAAIDIVSDLTADDMVFFLLSGGGSALFERPLISPNEMMGITRQLLACGADITEINTIRKRLSGVKGGRFARTCSPAKVFQIVLSDIVGDPLDMIASGPACVDETTSEEAAAIAEKYSLRLSDKAKQFLSVETVKKLDNVTTYITGSVRELCKAAENASRELGYETIFLTDRLSCEAKDAGIFISDIIKSHEGCGRKIAFIAGGETVVHLDNGKAVQDAAEKESPLGGRNQELSLAAAKGISGVEGACVFSIGSDGTDGPTDAAGGYVDHTTIDDARKLGISISDMLIAHDSYHALDELGGLIVTGSTGTNVNDVTVALLNQENNHKQM